MTTAADLRSRAGIPRSGFQARICAAVTAASCLAHVWLVAGNQHGMWLNLLMLAMVAVCLPCAVHIWRQGRVSSLRQVMASALVMSGVHAVLLLGSGGSGAGGPGHRHGGTVAAVAGAAPSGSWALLAVIALEMTTALLAATLLARLRAQSSG